MSIINYSIFTKTNHKQYAKQHQERDKVNSKKAEDEVCVGTNFLEIILSNALDVKSTKSCLLTK